MTSSPDQRQMLRALVRGQVQGVGFRFFVRDHAATLGLTGYARNLSNGTTVEVVAEGPTPALEALATALRQGPPLAHVERVDISWAAATGEYPDFRVA